MGIACAAFCKSRTFGWTSRRTTRRQCNGHKTQARTANSARSTPNARCSSREQHGHECALCSAHDFGTNSSDSVCSCVSGSKGIPVDITDVEQKKKKKKKKKKKVLCVD